MPKQVRLRDLPGGPVDIEFSDEISRRSICTKCRMVAMEMYADPKEHVFCKHCIDECSPVEKIYCSEERKDIEFKEMQEAFSVMTILMKMKVYCPNKGKGCYMMPDFMSLEDHFMKCDKTLLTCKCCKKSLKGTEYKNHELLCTEKRVQCSYCFKPQARGSLKDHKRVCGEQNTHCAKCGDDILRKEYTMHEYQCTGVKQVKQVPPKCAGKGAAISRPPDVLATGPEKHEHPAAKPSPPPTDSIIWEHPSPHHARNDFSFDPSGAPSSRNGQGFVGSSNQREGIVRVADETTTTSPGTSFPSSLKGQRKLISPQGFVGSSNQRDGIVRVADETTTTSPGTSFPSSLEGQRKLISPQDPSGYGRQSCAPVSSEGFQGWEIVDASSDDVKGVEEERRQPGLHQADREPQDGGASSADIKVRVHGASLADVGVQVGGASLADIKVQVHGVSLLFQADAEVQVDTASSADTRAQVDGASLVDAQVQAGDAPLRTDSMVQMPKDEFQRYHKLDERNDELERYIRTLEQKILQLGFQHKEGRKNELARARSPGEVLKQAPGYSQEECLHLGEAPQPHGTLRHEEAHRFGSGGRPVPTAPGYSHQDYPQRGKTLQPQGASGHGEAPCVGLDGRSGPLAPGYSHDGYRLRGKTPEPQGTSGHGEAPCVGLDGCSGPLAPGYSHDGYLLRGKTPEPQGTSGHGESPCVGSDGRSVPLAPGYSHDGYRLRGKTPEPQRTSGHGESPCVGSDGRSVPLAPGYSHQDYPQRGKTLQLEGESGHGEAPCAGSDGRSVPLVTSAPRSSRGSTRQSHVPTDSKTGVWNEREECSSLQHRFDAAGTPCMCDDAAYPDSK